MYDAASLAGSSYLIPLVCSIMGFLGLVAIILIIVWHNRRRRRRTHRHEPQRLEHKSNNENEDNLRRYRNPLFLTDKGGGTGTETLKTTSTELIEIDLEKYEKSPRRIVGRTDSTNESKQNTPPIKTRKKKDINIEIQRTLSTDREVVV